MATVTPDIVRLPHAGPPRRRRLKAAALLFAIGLIGAAFVLAVPVDTPFASTASSPGVEWNAAGEVIIPGIPTNGVLTITIPAGTAEAMALGGRGYVLPPVIQLRKGDKIVIHNNDMFPHIMMFAFVMPGETTERTFDKAVTETYSAGCTIDPTPNGFSSLFVSE